MSTDRTASREPRSPHDLVHALEDFLSSLVSPDAHAVVMIDEAQHIQPEVLEQVRLLSNIDAPSGTRLQIIPVGQLDLRIAAGASLPASVLSSACRGGSVSVFVVASFRTEARAADLAGAALPRASFETVKAHIHCTVCEGE